MRLGSLLRQCVGALVIVSMLILSAVNALADRNGYRNAIRNAARAERPGVRPPGGRPPINRPPGNRPDLRPPARPSINAGAAAVRAQIRHNARHRYYRNIAIKRRYGHWYHGYGGYHQDNDAFKWLAFTAISLKLLDMVNEEQQRRHEQAMIDATSARIGVPVTWRDGNASGRVIALNETRNNEGLMCREFQQEIIVGGKKEDGFGTACLQPDGAWKIVN